MRIAKSRIVSLASYLFPIVISFLFLMQYRKERVVEALGMTYALPFPHLQPRTCRGIKRTPLHFILESTQNPCFKLTSGWESPMYYGKVNSTQHSFGRESWYPIWKQEHEACREAVCLFDMSFMSKILVQVRFHHETLFLLY